MTKKTVSNDVLMIPVASIIVDEEWNPRKNYQGADEKRDSLEDLKRSIEKRGLLQPVMVRKTEDEEGNAAYQLIAGFRRMRAVQALGLDVVPATVREVDEPEALVDNVVENVQREQLSPAELAEALFRLSEMEMSGNVISKRVGLSKAYVNFLVAIRRKATPGLWEAFEQGKATVNQAYKAVGAGTTEEEQMKALHKALGMVEEEDGDGDGGDGDEKKSKKEKRNKRPSVKELEAYLQCVREMARGRLDLPSDNWTAAELEKCGLFLSWAAGARKTPPFKLPTVDAGNGEEE